MAVHAAQLLGSPALLDLLDGPLADLVDVRTQDVDFVTWARRAASGNL